jgi:hypothetical protein
VRLNEIYASHQDRAHFFIVYIREAHAQDYWISPHNLYEGIHVDQPKTYAEREEMAGVCQIELGLELPMLIDTIDNATEEKYIAKPDRLFVIDGTGIVTYNGAHGPFGFKPDEWEAALLEILGKG